MLPDIGPSDVNRSKDLGMQVPHRANPASNYVLSLVL